MLRISSRLKDKFYKSCLVRIGRKVTQEGEMGGYFPLQESYSSDNLSRDTLRSKIECQEGNGKLRAACPRIYALAIKKHGVIQDFGRWQGMSWCWDVPLRRNLFDWENDQCCTVSKMLKKQIMEVWTPPNDEALRFNVDGSARGSPGNAGVGGVLKDKSGKVLGLVFQLRGDT
ncbi:hypothetical protein Dsin_004764 [Dipteronia sinensis]|uniref:RNase H type-1 domain-containing protein n=1 Tax=Dipteronia sinensis TaxID=43782 RepID=A0AAE0EEJ3_9ROSI|nr:hypothetical protein Dsin_004764 [Dipteronia sinensis]